MSQTSNQLDVSLDSIHLAYEFADMEDIPDVHLVSGRGILQSISKH